MFVGTEQTARLMRDLKEEGIYRLPAEALAAMRAEFSAAWADEDETATAIRAYFEKYNYLADPHTAVGLSAYEKWLASDEANEAPTVILSTASPYKFSRHVLAALGHAAGEDEFADMNKLSSISGTPIPAPLAALSDKEERHKAICDVDKMSAYVRAKTEEKEWNV
jgi:threonine synthase